MEYESDIKSSEATAGIYLKAAKEKLQIRKGRPSNEMIEAGHLPWPKFLQTYSDIGRSRANELIQIAGGKKTVEEVREETNERQERFRNKSPLRNGDFPTTSLNQQPLSDEPQPVNPQEKEPAPARAQKDPTTTKSLEDASAPPPVDGGPCPMTLGYKEATVSTGKSGRTLCPPIQTLVRQNSECRFPGRRRASGARFPQ